MSGEPTVSVVIPTMDRADRLERAVESVVDQTYDDIEIVVVDGGSTDRTPDLVSEYQQRLGKTRVTYLRNENPQGLPAARNQGVRATDADLLAFLDDDDRWEPSKTERQVKQFQSRPDIGLSYTGRVSRTDDGEHVHTAQPSLEDEVFPALLVRNHIGSPSRVMVSAAAFDAVGGFDAGLKYQEDWEFYLRIAREYSIGCISDPMVVRTAHEGGMSRDAERQKRHREMILDRYESALRQHGVYDRSWATHHVDTAVAHFLDGDIEAVRRELSTTFRYQITPKALLLYLVSLLGSRGFRLVLGMKRRLAR